jgi:hypothetical protein
MELLDKKLKSHWSSATLPPTLDASFIDDIRSRFDKFDKRAKVCAWRVNITFNL